MTLPARARSYSFYVKVTDSVTTPVTVAPNTVTIPINPILTVSINGNLTYMDEDNQRH
jgi:hypothetical protein